MQRPETHELTAILQRYDEANEDDRERLFGMVYEELRQLAGATARRSRGSSVEPTSIVHDAFFRLVDRDGQGWESRSHFFCVASKAMRQILADRARRSGAVKRGGDWRRVTISGEVLELDEEMDIDLAALDDALAKLGGLDERKCQVVELRFFGGLEVTEIAQVIGVSDRTVKSDWRAARAWLRRELSR